MTYLFLTRWPPYPPLIGADIEYARELMTSLAEHRLVYALAFERSDVRILPHPNISWGLVPHREPARWRSLVSPLPSVAARHWSRRYLKAAVDAGRRAEAILIDFIALAWCVEPLKRALSDMKQRPPIIVITQNHEHAVRRQMVQAAKAPVMRAALALDAWKAGRLERASNRAADGLSAITEADRAALSRDTGALAVVLTPGYNGPAICSRTLGPEVPPVVTIMGNHAAHHKRMVLLMTLKKLAERGIGQRFRVEIVGGGDHKEFERSFPNFHYLGFVNDLEQYLSGTRLGLMPDAIGGGFKLRALTYAFNRVPMLALHHAMAGMGFEAGRHFAGADTLDELADKIPGLIEDFPRLNDLQSAAFDHCRSGFSWKTRGRDLHLFAQSLRGQAKERTTSRIDPYYSEP